MNRAEWAYLAKADEWELRLGDFRARLWRWGPGRWVRTLRFRDFLLLEDMVNAPNVTGTDTIAAQDEARRWAGRLLAEAVERVGVEP